MGLTHQVETLSEFCQFPHPGNPALALRRHLLSRASGLFVYLVKLIGLAFERIKRLFIVFQIIASHDVHLLLQNPATQQFCTAKEKPSVWLGAGYARWELVCGVASFRRRRSASHDPPPRGD